MLWEKCFQLAPEACRKFALGVWRHQIADHKTGEFSRHARFDQHGPAKGWEFPRHGGFYITTWASAYGRCKDAELLEAIECLLASFEDRRHRDSGAIPSTVRSSDLHSPQSELSLALDLWDGAKRVPGALAAKMRASAARTDEVFLKAPHDVGPGGKGFVAAAATATLQPSAFTQTWATGYGLMTDAQYSMLCLLRYRQVRKEPYRKLFLAAADRYLASAPDTSIALYPGAVADAIAAMLGAWRLTGDAKYLQRADTLGRLAAELFFADGPLPRASTRHDHYEAITRADTLAMELLNLWGARNRPRLNLGMIYPER
ncbi:MAG: hypothetical protein AAB654_02915 [Acidobacteriota bacterium]